MLDTNIVIYNDPHNSDINPSSRIDNYCEAILAKQQFIIDFAIKHNAIILHGGDWFHRKRPDQTSHFLVNRLISMFAPLGSNRIFSVIGNHDYYPTIPDIEHSPLGVLENFGIVTLLRGKPIIVGDISLNGVDWDEKMEITPQLYDLPHLSAKWKISIYHQYVLPDNDYLAAPHLKFSEVYKYLPDISIFGHYHLGFNQGALGYGDKLLINPGSIAREKASKENLQRNLCFGFLILPEQGLPRFSTISIPFKATELVFDMTKRAKTIVEHEKLEEFVRHFAAEIVKFQDVDISSFEELTQLVKSLNLAPALEAIVIRLLSEANDEIV